MFIGNFNLLFKGVPAKSKKEEEEIYIEAWDTRKGVCLSFVFDVFWLLF